MGNDKVGQIIEEFKKYDSSRTVVAIWNKKDLYVIIAKHNPDKNAVEMDPFYVYADGKGIDGITYVDNQELLTQVMKPEYLIYERK